MGPSPHPQLFILCGHFSYEGPVYSVPFVPLVLRPRVQDEYTYLLKLSFRFASLSMRSLSLSLGHLNLVTFCLSFQGVQFFQVYLKDVIPFSFAELLSNWEMSTSTTTSHSFDENTVYLNNGL